MKTSNSKIWLAFALLATSFGSIAQSQLPRCPDVGTKSNCWGEGADFYGRKYVGEFRDGIPNGRGTSTWASGEQYIGEHSAGKREGFGTNSYVNGEKYVGWWKNDVSNGEGILYGAGGSVLKSGNWVDGTFAAATERAPAIATTTMPTAPIAIAPPPPPGAPTSSIPNRNSISVSCPGQVAPQMPRDAQREGVGGQVKAMGRVKDGAVVEVFIVSGPHVFHEPVRHAMTQYKCVGEMPEQWATQVFNFRIEGTSNNLPPNETEYEKQVKAAALEARRAIPVSCPTQIPPEMPLKAQQERIEGVVRAQIRIKNGLVQDVTMTGPRVFYPAVRTAVMQYKCIADDREAVAIQEFNFSLIQAPKVDPIRINSPMERRGAYPGSNG